MTVVIEHVRHRVAPRMDALTVVMAMARTACGRRFLGCRDANQWTEYHQPATSRCEECFR